MKTVTNEPNKHTNVNSQREDGEELYEVELRVLRERHHDLDGRPKVVHVDEEGCVVVCRTERVLRRAEPLLDPRPCVVSDDPGLVAPGCGREEHKRWIMRRLRVDMGCECGICGLDRRSMCG